MESALRDVNDTVSLRTLSLSCVREQSLSHVILSLLTGEITISIVSCFSFRKRGGIFAVYLSVWSPRITHSYGL